MRVDQSVGRAKGAAEVYVLLPLRDPGRLLPLRGRLAASALGIGSPGPAPDRADVCTARDSAEDPHHSCGPGRGDARQVGGPLAGRSGERQEPTESPASAWRAQRCGAARSPDRLWMGMPHHPRA